MASFARRANRGIVLAAALARQAGPPRRLDRSSPAPMPPVRIPPIRDSVPARWPMASLPCRRKNHLPLQVVPTMWPPSTRRLTIRQKEVSPAPPHRSPRALRAIPKPREPNRTPSSRNPPSPAPAEPPQPGPHLPCAPILLQPRRHAAASRFFKSAMNFATSMIKCERQIIVTSTILPSALASTSIQRIDPTSQLLPLVVVELPLAFTQIDLRYRVFGVPELLNGSVDRRRRRVSGGRENRQPLNRIVGRRLHPLRQRRTDRGHSAYQVAIFKAQQVGHAAAGFLTNQHDP